MRTVTTLLAASAIALAAVPAQAQTSTRDRIGQILGQLLGRPVEAGAAASVDAQWAAGQTPLATDRVQFETQVDTAVRERRITQATGTRLKADYLALVQLEARYGADRRFNTTERADLVQRYNALAAVVAAGRYADEAVATPVVADGQAEFNRRVDAQVSARRLSRTQGSRLKTDYTALVRVEAGYLADGVITDAEREDLDTRLDALDVRVGDVAYTPAPQTPQQRLDAIESALRNLPVTAQAQAQIRTEHGDLSRLAAAYARLTTTAEERAYLDARLTDLETRARVRR
ncbi:hypothetical protein [Alteraurantiacibacter buctensis]|uniref:Uncharacterized protein n=1 Tax=Alteraurantiacibacter buctensis TaxID=1503981 RepID=A0A844YYE9_9SPHN|nr:hypothetical protein [Alteraurantiacibacter buctensis]MXO72579.1 hypothetical protein [Alteraurantiacibacter buctensis]